MDYPDRDVMIFLSALCITIPLLTAWVRLWIWDAQAERGYGDNE